MPIRRRLLACVLMMLLSIPILSVVAQNRARVIPMGNSLRLRTAPTVDSETLDFLVSGTELIVLSQTTDNSWFEVQIAGSTQQGWVASDFVEPVSTLDLPAATIDFSDTVVNGVPILTGMNQNVLDIFRRGQVLGNRANVFTKVGDSITYTDYFLDVIGDGVYNLDTYWYLDSVINFFNTTNARDENSFKHNSVAAQTGWNAYLLQDPEYANGALCYAGETPLECEYRITRPSIALIMLGTNDAGFVDAYAFRVNMEWIIRTSIDNGVIPVISTIPNRIDVPERVREFNAIIRDLAGQYRIPLWDYHAILETLPGQGLSGDGVHPSGSPAGWVGHGDFTESNLQYGFPMRNLTALLVLNSLWQQVIMQA